MSAGNQESTGQIVSEHHFFTPVINWVNEHHELVLSHIANLFAAILILIVGIYITGFISRSINRTLLKKGLDATIVDFISTMARYALISIVFIAALTNLGVQMASFIAVLSAAALAIGLALKGALSDFASGILLIILRPFKSGDYVEVSGTAGSVESILLLNSVLKSPDNKHIVVPNSSILKGKIINYSRKPERRIDLVIRVSYQSDLMQAKQVLKDVVLANEKVLKQPELQIGVAELSNSNINIVVRPWVKSADYWPVRFALTENIKNALQAAQIDIPYPQLDIHKK
ncbi:mechanosensitive ion channel [Psychromonas sp. RZ22]|uniref:mechanosensitive ion channel domain-containing protein n=1 Tax=Psychromonas algarum TaxID=2555643 RepID=UPI00106794BF|nr:mechanosensitive ion channel domain-containing protein [Psychromonas sp. RZ22]TEW56956.1 mechanosensitive ion channel [Psychromonas sp. RZ22]